MKKKMGFNLLLFCEQFRVSYYRGLSCSRKVHLGPKSSLGDLDVWVFPSSNNNMSRDRRKRSGKAR